jgi:DNA polymerase-3 subunit gamma/tau
VSAVQLGSTPGTPRSPHGGPDRLSAKAPAAVQPPQPHRDAAPPRTLSAEAQLDSAPVQPASADLTGMDLIKRELGGRVIAEIDEP